MAIYMNYNNLGVKGRTTAEGYQDWIELNSFQFGVGRGIGSPVGASTDREASAPSVSEIVVTKVMEDASISLFQDALIGEGVPVIIHFTKTNKDQLAVYLEIKLEATLISGYSVSSGGDAPSESISLNFTKIELKYHKQGETGTTAEPVAAGYDLALAKQV